MLRLHEDGLRRNPGLEGEIMTRPSHAQPRRGGNPPGCQTRDLPTCRHADLAQVAKSRQTAPALNQKELNLVTIRGSLIQIVTTSIAGYLLHLFTKLAISSFHLSRDYRERFQLTSVFLALLNDGIVKCDDKIKQIVMQSLFGRSDTGLLKGKHSYAIPEVSDLLKYNNTWTSKQLRHPYASARDLTNC